MVLPSVPVLGRGGETKSANGVIGGCPKLGGGCSGGPIGVVTTGGGGTVVERM